MIEWADRNSAQLDDYWDKYAGSCVSTSSGTGDRSWFAVFETNGVRLNLDVVAQLSELARHASD